MKHLIRNLVALCAVTAVLASALPEAEGARKASLSESRLILDRNDVYLYPQTVTEYSNLASFDYGFDDAEGSGLALFGDEEMTLGLGIYRGDLLGWRDFFPHDAGHPNLGNIDNPLATPGIVGPSTMADIFGGFQAGAGSLGARLSLGQGADTLVDLEDEQSGERQTFVGATIGYSMVDDFRIDSSATLQVSSGSEFIEDDDTLVDATSLLIGASGRMYFPASQDFELSILADLAYTGVNWDEQITEDDTVQQSLNTVLAMAGAGPVYDLDAGTVAAYGVVGHIRTTLDPDVDEDDNLTRTNLTVLPGLHLAAEIELRDWLFFRSGMQYSFDISREVQEFDVDDTDRNDTIASARGDAFGWRAGMGVEIDDFKVDGAFQSGFITNGPAFLGGDPAGGMFTMISASYHF